MGDCIVSPLVAPLCSVQLKAIAERAGAVTKTAASVRPAAKLSDSCSNSNISQQAFQEAADKAGRGMSSHYSKGDSPTAATPPAERPSLSNGATPVAGTKSNRLASESLWGMGTKKVRVCGLGKAHWLCTKPSGSSTNQHLTTWLASESHWGTGTKKAKECELGKVFWL